MLQIYATTYHLRSLDNRQYLLWDITVNEAANTSSISTKLNFSVTQLYTCI